MRAKTVFSQLFELVIIFSIGFGLVYLVFALYKNANAPRPVSHERILYLRDSLEMEWYKQTLEESFNYDHSKIPDNESDTGVQPTGR